MSAQLRYAGVVSPAEAKVRELIQRSREALTAKQIAQRLGYTEATVNEQLRLLAASGQATRRRSRVKPRFPYVYSAARSQAAQ